MGYAETRIRVAGMLPKAGIGAEIGVWKGDFSALAVGSDDGVIVVLAYPSLRLLCTVHVHRKLINAIQWHPEFTSSSSEWSKFNTWIATASAGFNVQIVDLSQVFGKSCLEYLLVQY